MCVVTFGTVVLLLGALAPLPPAALQDLQTVTLLKLQHTQGDLIPKRRAWRRRGEEEKGIEERRADKIEGRGKRREGQRQTEQGGEKTDRGERRMRGGEERRTDIDRRDGRGWWMRERRVYGWRKGEKRGMEEEE